MKRVTFGFGMDPKQSQNHFFVLVPPKESSSVTPATIQVFERYTWTEGEEQQLQASDVLRHEISQHKWNLIKADLTAEFNFRLKKDGIKIGKFPTNGGIAVERLFGQEMMVLLWAMEESDPSLIPTAIRNWKGLLPEERWWLYTMTNAATGGLRDKKGWRRALRYALCENPVVERRQMSMFELEDAPQ